MEDSNSNHSSHSLMEHLSAVQLTNPYWPAYNYGGVVDSYIFKPEYKFDHKVSREWMQKNWHTAFYWVALYMVLIFGGQAFMSSRPAFKLRRILAIWNISLAVFSIAGTIRTLPEMYHVLTKFSFYHSVCNPSYVEEVKISGYWTWMFTLSKLPELGDTIFIVLRKQNLIFLHWYHHITVLLFTWFVYGQHISTARWYVNMNYIVHSLMYSYYALRALGFRVPKQIAMVITSSQIVQMMAGAYVSYYAYQRKLSGEFCQMDLFSAQLALTMYGSYFVLFAKFFFTSYFLSGTTGVKVAAEGAKTKVKKIE